MKLFSDSTRYLLDDLAGLLTWGRDWSTPAGADPWVRDGQSLAQDWRRVGSHLHRALEGWANRVA